MKKSIVLGLACCLSFPASAVEGSNQTSLFLGVGKYFVDDYCQDLPDYVSCEDSDLSFTLGVQNKFNEVISLSFDGSYLSPLLMSDGVLDIESGMLTFGLQLGAHAQPTEKSDLFIKAGIAYWKADLDVRYYYESFSDSESDTDLKFSVGGTYALNEKTALGLQFDLYPDLGNDMTGETDFTNVSAVIVFSF